MTKEEWLAVVSNYDSLERHQQRRQSFDDPATPIEGLILFREDGTYFLVNRSGQTVDSLIVKTVRVDDMRRMLAAPRTYRIVDIRPSTYVALHSASPEPQQKNVYVLTRVNWASQESWIGRRVLACQTPITVGRRLQQFPIEMVVRSTNEE